MPLNTKASVFNWTPATAELELLHECWLARLPPAMIAARLGVSEPKLKRFMRRLKTACDMPRPEPARPPPAAPSSVIQRRRSAACAHLRRIEACGCFNGGGGGECGLLVVS
jgi:hypothetical protein